MIGLLYQTVPLTVGGVGFLVLYFALRRTRWSSHYLLWPAVAWLLAALDEWYMSTFQPQMNIRVDALPFMLLVATTTLSCVPMTFLHRRPQRQ